MPLGPIKACQRCGSGDLRHASLRDGAMPGLWDFQGSTCNVCGHTGPELLFDTEEARAAYASAQAADSSGNVDVADDVGKGPS